MRRALAIAALAAAVATGGADGAEPGRDTRSAGRLDRALATLRSAPGRADAELRIIDIFDEWDLAGPNLVRRALEAALDLSGISPAARERARHLLALASIRTGDPSAAAESYRERGFVSTWSIIGPFDNEGGTGLETPYGPEPTPVAAPDPQVEFEGLERAVRWRRAPPGSAPHGLLRIDWLVEPDAEVCAFCQADLESDRAGDAVLRLGAGGAFSAWWNGTPALNDGAYREPDPDRSAAEVRVRAGTNRLLVKVCSNEDGRLGLWARVTDRERSPWPIRAVEPSAAEVPPDSTGRTRPVPSTMERLLGEADAKGASPARIAAAASFLHRTGARHRSSHRARDLARASCERAPSAERCLLWAALAMDPNERRQAVLAARAAEPGSPEALLAEARLERARGDRHRARDLVRRVLSQLPDDLEAGILAAEIDADEGLSLTALAAAVDLSARFSGAAAAARIAERLARGAESLRISLDMTLALSGLRADDTDVHASLARAALARGDRRASRRHLEDISNVAPLDGSALAEIARILEGSGDAAGAERALRRLVEATPENPEAWRSLGLLLSRLDRREESIDALRTARGLRPQDAWLADYLDRLDPTPRFEAPYVVPLEEILSGRGRGRGEKALYLADVTVARVRRSGLASRFVQRAVEIGTREAAREWRVQTIPFAPGRQRVKLLEARVVGADGSEAQSTNRWVVSLSEPWYRLYYDVEAEVVEMPPLEPGDVVELRYLVEDTAPRNDIADHFGDIAIVEDEIPKALWRYVLIAPSDRAIRVREPRLEGLAVESRAEGGSSATVFEARNVAAVLPEGDMPGATSNAQYLHVSTFGSWEELGAWYAGLVRDQTIADSRIREKVRELVSGVDDPMERVAAIHRWVVTATRYVGLEFGIHGYKPYRAPLVAARGFGDCKDKATLLVTMLEEAGIEADLAVVRTRSLGDIDEEPASLAVFDHAIVRVPSLDLWLDGTAEHHGIMDLPFADQGVLAIPIRESDAAPVRTPLLPADRNSSSQRVEVLLDPDGEARIDVEASASGSFAARLRRDYEVEGSRRERFEASLVKVYPGARLGDLSFAEIADLERPVRYEYSAFVPEWAIREGEDLLVPTDAGPRLTERWGKLPSRRLDLVVGPASRSTRAISMEVPAGFEVRSLPSAAVIESRFGRLLLEVAEEGGRIEVVRDLTLMARTVPASKHGEFLDFCRQVDEALAERIALRRAR